MRTRYKHICQTCGKRFETTLKDSPFCSVECRRYQKTCLICGKEYVSRHKKGKYCSQRCKNKSLPKDYYIKWNQSRKPTGEFTETTDEMIVECLIGGRRKKMTDKQTARFIGRDYETVKKRIAWLEKSGNFKRLERVIWLQRNETSPSWNICRDANMGYKNTYAIW